MSVEERLPARSEVIPRDQRGSDRAFLVEELRRLAETRGHEPDAADWAEALEAEGAADRALAALYRNRPWP